MDALGEPLGVVAAGPDLLALLADDGGGAGVLAEGQDAVGGDLGVACSIISATMRSFSRGLGVVEDGGDLREVGRAQGEVDRLDRLVGEQGEALRGRS